MFIEDRIEELKEQERAAYIAGNVAMADLIGELVNVKMDLLHVGDNLQESQLLVEELQAEVTRQDAEINYLRARLALAEGD
jgi:cell division protein FtsL